MTLCSQLAKKAANEPSVMLYSYFLSLLGEPAVCFRSFDEHRAAAEIPRPTYQHNVHTDAGMCTKNPLRTLTSYILRKLDEDRLGEVRDCMWCSLSYTY